MNRPGDFLLNPWVPASIVVLVLNDHVLKAEFGGVLTGKLSDVAGVFLLPFLMLALYEGALRPFTRRWQASTVVMTIAVAITGVGFAAVKSIDPVGDAYAWMVGLLRKIVTFSAEPVTPILVYRDLTDLLVLPILIGTVLVWRRCRPAPAAKPFEPVLARNEKVAI